MQVVYVDGYLRGLVGDGEGTTDKDCAGAHLGAGFVPELLHRNRREVGEYHVVFG